MGPTTEFDYLMKKAFTVLYPSGSGHNYFRAKNGDDCYHGGVKPDFVLPNGAWVDFKLHVSYRESHDVAWKPSALYSSLRKYIDHVDNNQRQLNVVFGKLHGSINDVVFPILRGPKVLVADKNDFDHKVKLKPASDVLQRLLETEHRWIFARVMELVR